MPPGQASVVCFAAKATPRKQPERGRQGRRYPWKRRSTNGCSNGGRQLPRSRQARCPTGLLAAGIGGPRWPANADIFFKNGYTAFVPTARARPASGGCVPSGLALSGGEHRRGGGGGGARSALRQLTRASCLSAARSAQRVLARAPGPRSAAQSTRRGDRHDASPGGTPPPLARAVVAGDGSLRLWPGRPPRGS